MGSYTDWDHAAKVIALYLLVTKNVLGLLHCSWHDGRWQLVNGPTVVRDYTLGGWFNNETVPTTELLECFKGKHLAAGALAVVVMILFVLGYPLATLYYVKRVVITNLDKSTQRRQRWPTCTHAHMCMCAQAHACMHTHMHARTHACICADGITLC